MPNETITLFISNTNGSAANLYNITNISIILPDGFTYSGGSNATNITNFGGFFSSGQYLNFSNLTDANTAGLNNTVTGNITFKVKPANYSGIYNFTIILIDNTNAANTSVVNISVSRDMVLNDTQWTVCGPADAAGNQPRGCGAPGVNSTGGFFFYDGNSVSVVINITDRTTKMNVTNLTVLVNFTQIGNATLGSGGLTTAVYDASEGLYYAKGTVDFANAATWLGTFNNNMANALINVLVDECVGHPSANCDVPGANQLNGTRPIFTNVMLVNMSTFGCPPSNAPGAAQMFAAMTNMPYYVNPTNTSLVNVAGCIDYTSNLNSTWNANASCAAAFNLTSIGFPPIVYNGSRYLMCGPNFDSSITTNLSQWAQNRWNMSKVFLVFDIPGQGRINFTGGVNFNDPTSMQGVMDFAMKALTSRGRIGINETEFSGSNVSGMARPNLTVSATLWIYNVTNVFGYSTSKKPNVAYGAYNGNSAPTSVIPCNSTKCSSVSFDGENLSFTVNSWSTYVIADSNYTLQFANASGPRVATLPANTSARSAANTTFYVDITNLGNTSSVSGGEFFYLNFTGMPECNRTRVQTGGAGGAAVNSQNLTAGCLNFLNVTNQNTLANGTIIHFIQGGSNFLTFNFTANSTPGTYTFGISAYLVNTSNVTETYWNLNSTSDGINWAVTVVPFIITIANPVNASNISTSSGIVAAIAGNQTALAYVNYTINSSSDGEFAGIWTVLFGAPPSFTIKSDNFTNSAWQQMQNVTVWVNDTWGNVNKDIVQFVVDDSVPQATNFTYKLGAGAYSPLNSTTWINLTTAGITINVTGHDSITGITMIRLNVSNVTNNQVNLTNMSFAANVGSGNTNFTLPFNPSNYNPGHYNVSFVITDFSGNSNDTAATYTGRITIDNQQPNVTIISPVPAGNLILNESSIGYFNVTVFDNLLQPDGALFNLTNSSGTFKVNTSYVKVNNSMGYGLQFNLSLLQDGNYTLKIIANDTNNNINSTVNITFMVDNTIPAVTSWNYSLATKQLMVLFSDIIDNSTVPLSGFNVTYDDGTGLPFSTPDGYSLTGAKRHPNGNSSVLIVNLTSNMDTRMRELQAAGEGKLTVAAGAVQDRAGNVLAANNNVSISTWDVYGIEKDFTTSQWNSFNLPLTTLQNRTSLSGNYSVDKVLASIRDHYAGVFYYSSSTWASYVPGRTVNTFSTFSDDTATNNYWVYMTASDKLQIT